MAGGGPGGSALPPSQEEVEGQEQGGEPRHLQPLCHGEGDGAEDAPPEGDDEDLSQEDDAADEEEGAVVQEVFEDGAPGAPALGGEEVPELEEDEEGEELGEHPAGEGGGFRPFVRDFHAPGLEEEEDGHEEEEAGDSSGQDLAEHGL